MHRPATMGATEDEAAWRRAPTVKRASARRMTRRRPWRSARREASGEARRAKSEVEEVMIDLSKEVRVRLEREVSIETRVAEMTPVSSGGGSVCQFLQVGVENERGGGAGLTAKE